LQKCHISPTRLSALQIISDDPLFENHLSGNINEPFVQRMVTTISSNDWRVISETAKDCVKESIKMGRLICCLTPIFALI